MVEFTRPASFHVFVCIFVELYVCTFKVSLTLQKQKTMKLFFSVDIIILWLKVIKTWWELASPFFYSQGQCKEGPVELQVVQIKYFLKTGQNVKPSENQNAFFLPTCK